MPDIRLGQAGQGHQRLDIELTQRALLRGAAAGFCGAGACQRIGGRCGKAGAGAQARQAGCLAARYGVGRRHGYKLTAGAQTLVLVGHFSGDRYTRVMPLRLGTGQAFTGRIAARQPAAKQVNFPAGLQARLDAAADGRRPRCHAWLRAPPAGTG